MTPIESFLKLVIKSNQIWTVITLFRLIWYQTIPNEKENININKTLTIFFYCSSKWSNDRNDRNDHLQMDVWKIRFTMLELLRLKQQFKITFRISNLNLFRNEKIRICFIEFLSLIPKLCLKLLRELFSFKNDLFKLVQGIPLDWHIWAAILIKIMSPLS